MALFAVSDVHGFFDEMKTALTEAGFFDSPENRLIVVGDALDRGKQAVKMADFLLGLHREGRLIYIYGNHEELFYKCLQDVRAGLAAAMSCGLSYHCRNGTWDTLLQLGGMKPNEAALYPEVLLGSVKATDYYRELLPAAVNYYETEKYIFCHGWIPLDVRIVEMTAEFRYNAAWRSASEEEWHKARWRNGMEMACMRGVREAGKTIVCGHWNCSWGHSRVNFACTEHGQDAITTPFYADGIIAIDACTARSGRVNCIVIEE